VNSSGQFCFTFKKRDYGTTLRTGIHLLTRCNNGQQNNYCKSAEAAVLILNNE
jgi:hypothetical protein